MLKFSGQRMFSAGSDWWRAAPDWRSSEVEREEQEEEGERAPLKAVAISEIFLGHSKQITAIRINLLPG